MDAVYQDHIAARSAIESAAQEARDRGDDYAALTSAYGAVLAELNRIEDTLWYDSETPTAAHERREREWAECEQAQRASRYRVRVHRAVPRTCRRAT